MSTFKELESGLKSIGIWRCKFVTYNFRYDKLGIIEMYVPKTTSESKIAKFIYNYIPAGATVQIKELVKPLKYKKYDYSYEIKM